MVRACPARGYILTPLIPQWTDTELQSALEGVHPIGLLGEAKVVVDGAYLSV
jgi:hypothetical protein